MTNSEILGKAIKKAEKSGWKRPNVLPYSEATLQAPAFYVWIDKEGNFLSNRDIIFSHDFAKAFFGFEETTISNDYGDGGETKSEFMKRYKPYVKDTKSKEYEWNDLITEPAWQYHLQQMVLEEEPIQYLSKFI